MMKDENMFYRDQTGNEIGISSSPEKIISLVPSLTELLFDLGLDDRIIGITKFCNHPADKVPHKLKIGGTKNFRFRLIETLEPDFVLANKEENYKDGIEKMRKKYPVWVSDISTLDHAYHMIRSVGEITGTLDRAETIIQKIQTNFKSLQPKEKKKALYFIWRNPNMSVGGDTFISHIMDLCGFENCIKDKTRYPALSLEEIHKCDPEYILLSSEPFPFQSKHIQEFQDTCPKAKIILVDGEMFSWFGSRLQLAPEYLNKLISSI